MRKEEKDGALAGLSPPPLLTPMNSAEPRMLDDDEDKPPVIEAMEQVVKHPVLKAHLEEERGSVYPILYSHSQHSDVSFTRPVTPLQITIPDGNASPTVNVSCGSVNGRMHLNMFVCPGIHQPCIEIGSELLSPKQFTVRGDKEKQKDWKASIRIGRASLRTHMEASTIDFYDHPNRCSGKCQSRNYVNAPVEREDVAQSRKQKRTADTEFLKNEIEQEVHGKEPEEKKAVTVKKARGRPRGSVNKPRPIVKQEMHPDESFFDEFFVDEQPTPVSAMASEASVHAPPPERRQVCSDFADIMNCLQNDPRDFWTQMQQTGVITHFCDDLIVSVINLKQAVMDQAINNTTANTLTRTTFALGIQNVVVNRVQSIERSVVQQRKHEEMFQEIQSKVAEQRMAEEAKRNEEIQIISDVARSFEALQTAREITEPDDFIDVVKYEEHPACSSVSSDHQQTHNQQPGPSTVL